MCVEHGRRTPWDVNEGILDVHSSKFEARRSTPVISTPAKLFRTTKSSGNQLFGKRVSLNPFKHTLRATTRTGARKGTRLSAGSFGEPSASPLLGLCPEKPQERPQIGYRGILPNKPETNLGDLSETFLNTFPKTKTIL